MKKLWKKLFSKKDFETDAELHVAGATVRHRNTFEDLSVPRNSEPLGEDFIEKWVVPFYMTVFSQLSEETEQQFIAIYSEVDYEIVIKLLSDFNWRTRIVGAYFAALKDFTKLEEVIGNHLLKSEVCYAGRGYCMALANFGTKKSKNYLKEYLDYYLTRKDLWFDQGDALAALFWMDENAAKEYESLWNDFVADKPYWKLERYKENFVKSMENLEHIKITAREK
jgi:Family of unknown function (DUF6000)